MILAMTFLGPGIDLEEPITPHVDLTGKDDDGEEGNNDGGDDGNNNPEPPPSQKPQASDPLGSWLKEVKEVPKQDFTKKDKEGNPLSEDPEIAEEGAKETEEKKDLKPSNKAIRNGRRIAKSFDFLFSTGSQMATDAPTRAQYKADGEEMDELIEAWAEYFMEHDADIPAWVGLVIAMVCVYGFKIPAIRSDYRRNKAIRKAAEEKAAIGDEQDIAAIVANGEKQVPGDQTDTSRGAALANMTLNPDVNYRCLNCDKEFSPEQLKKKGRKYCNTVCSNGHAAAVRQLTNTLKNEKK